MRLLFFVVLILSSFIFSQSTLAKDKKKSCESIQHTVVIYLENHSFYNLFANFPGADNSFAENYQGQISEDGKLYSTLPIVTERNKDKTVDKRFPPDLANKPFVIDSYAKINERTPDPAHDFYTHIYQINDGKMDRFVSQSGTGAFVMGYYDMKNSNLWKYAKENTLADNFFQSAFGGSFINHQWLIAGKTPEFKNAPDKIKIKLYPDGRVQQQGIVTEDGYAVNSFMPFNPPYDPKATDATIRLPTLDYDTIGDRLSDKNISWAWYAGGWNKTLKGEKTDGFQYHHQPFIFYKKYGPNTNGRKLHLKDEDDLLTDIKKNKLPQVVFYKPIGAENAHPGYTDLESGDKKIKVIVDSILKSSLAKHTFIIITFDEHGGFWDPKAPPKVDRWGPGSRIPAIFISPNLKTNNIDHNLFETTSIIAGLEKKYKLPTMLERKPQNAIDFDACNKNQ